MNKNYGLDLEKEARDVKPEQDWVFGATSPKCIAEIPLDKMMKYLPKGEVQRGAEDTMDCASRSALNILEAKFNYLYVNNLLPQTHIDFLVNEGYLIETGIEFSDAFIAVKSGTTRQGNSLIAPLDAIHKYGLVPKWKLPLGKDMTFDEYHDPNRISAELTNLGKRFIELFTINYERVYERDFSEVTKTEFIDTGGFAWSTPKDGVYPRSENQPNHAFVVFYKPDFFCFDNYIDTDGDFIKNLAPNYAFISYGYRLIISINKNAKKKSLVERLIEWLKNLIKTI